MIRNIMKILVMLLVFSMGTGCRCGEGGPCSSEATARMARAYVLATPLMDGRLDASIDPNSPLTQYVQANQEHFRPHGPAIQCATVFAQRLRAANVQAYDPTAGDKIVERWGAQAPEAAQAAARNVATAGGDFGIMALELLWLAGVLPDIAEGNLVTFNQTGTPARQQMRQAVMVAKTISPENRDIAVATLKQFSRSLAATAETHVAALARAVVGG